MKHILVPVDLLSELAESLACELDARYPASVRSYESQDRKYQAEMEPVLTARKIIAAPPAVQGEPVATIHVDGSFVHVEWRIPAPSRCAMDVYTAPQPAEQQPELAKYQPCGCVICTCEHETQCQGCGGHHCGTHPVGQFSNPVYQQPAPDVAGLVEVLQKEATSLCDAVENINDLPPVMYALQAGAAVNKVRDAVAALAAHRKQGGES